MTVEAINHINIAAPAPLLKELRDFYVDVIGLIDGERPGIGIRGYWLYGGGKALLHLMEPRGEPPSEQAGTGAIDHIALTCTDFHDTVEKLEQSGIPLRKREDPQRGVAQVFLTDPAGVLVELNFKL